MKKYFFILSFITAAANISFSQVELGEKVPDFSATDQNGSIWSLKNNLGSSDYLVIYFYPGAFTGGCTKQACSYRDQKGNLMAVGASVVGISGDKPETQRLFALENQLNFTLLSDESGEIATLLGVPQKEGTTINREINGKAMDLVRGTTIQRWTFILDEKGILIYKDSEVNAAEDSGRVIKFLSSLK